MALVKDHMQKRAPVYILRHRKERLSKCSLRSLEHDSEYGFFTYPDQTEQLAQILLNLPQPICLTPEGSSLRQSDSALPLVLLDGTWRLSKRLFAALDHHLKGHWQPRSLPQQLITAYPRRQHDCPLPGRGLSSIEALAAAFHVLNNRGTQLLNGYRWRDEFLVRNEEFFSAHGPHHDLDCSSNEKSPIVFSSDAR